MIATPIACVVDASVAIKTLVPEADSAQARDLFAHVAADPASRFFVPTFFFLECGNILWKHAHLRGSITPAEAQSKPAALEALPLQALSTKDLAASALTIALAHGLTTYDACYVAASVQERVPLITADDRLVRKLAGTMYVVHLLSSLTIPAVPPPPPRGGVTP